MMKNDGDAVSIVTVTDLAGLSAMEWQEFEHFAVRVLARYYHDSGLDVKPTRETINPTRDLKDGGRDGDAVYTFKPIDAKPGCNQDLDINVKLWIEVKMRRSRSVNLDDIGGNIVLSDNAGVSKIVFVTNSDFTDRLIKEVELFCNRHRLSCAFIKGSRLLKMGSNINMTSPPAMRADRPPDTLPITVRFSSSAFSVDDILGAEPLYLESGAPAFLIIDFDVGDSAAPLLALPEVSICDQSPPPLYWSSFQPPLLIGERCRSVYVIWPEPGTVLSADDVVVRFPGSSTPLLIRDVQGSVHVCPRYLAQVDMFAQRNAATMLDSKVSAWLEDGGVSLIGLRGYPGVGKSYLLNKLRRRWLDKGAPEILLDGEVQRDASSLCKATFDAVMHLPSVDGDEIERAILEHLGNLSLHGEQAERLAAGMRSMATGETTEHDPNKLAETLVVALRLSAAKRQVLLIEDIHKIAPSGLHMFVQMIRLLRYHARGNLLIVATSRPFHAGGTILPNGPAVQQDTLESVFEEFGADLVTIDAVRKSDAAIILQETIQGIDVNLAGRIIESVGTTPFALKEVVAYLAQLKKVKPVDVTRGIYRLVSLEALQTRLQPETLKRVTRNRLEILLKARRAHYPWLSDFLIAGAVLGRKFTVALVFGVMEASETGLDTTMGSELFRWDVLGIQGPKGQREAVFNHDLIRSALLDSAEQTHARHLAAALFDAGRERLTPLVLARLGLHAGLHQESARLAAEEAAMATQERRHWDALQAHLLRLHANDPGIFETLIQDDRLRSLAPLDDALFRIGAAEASTTVYVADRRRRTYDTVVDCLECLTRIGVGKQHGFSALVSEGAMLANELNDALGRGRLEYYHGRIEFDQDCFANAAKHHHAAERIYESLDNHDRTRIDNLNRLFLCYRQLGMGGQAAAVLDTLERFNHAREDFEQSSRILAYRGYALLYVTPDDTLHLWRRAAEAASEKGRMDRFAEHVVGCGYMELLIGTPEQAGADFQAADQALGKADAGSPRLRLHLNRGVLGLITNRLDVARTELEEAARIGITYVIMRRLWRVDANLATLHEALGNDAHALAYDSRCIAGLRSRLRAEAELGQDAPWLVQRHALPVLNIMLRARAGAPDRGGLLEDLPVPQRSVIEGYAGLVEAGAVAGLPVGVRIHVKSVRDRLRCIVTE